MSSQCKFQFIQEASKEFILKQYEEIVSKAEGELPYSLTNDYLFRVLFQVDENARRHLIAALLHLSVKEILNCEVLNPIQPGAAIDEKECVLDLKVLLNSTKIINIEMQVARQAFWNKRALYYTCKNYTNLKKGENYSQTIPCVHIGILPNSPFSDHNTFYSEYYLTDKHSGHIYSGDFILNVLNLSCIDQIFMRKEQDEPLCQWARLFLAKEWKELPV